MRKTTLTLAATLVLSLTGGAFAQTAAGGGSATGNMNNPGSVKSNGEKANERTTGSATGGTAGTMGGAAGTMGGAGNMGGGTGTSSNTGVGLGAAGNTQGPRQ